MKTRLPAALAASSALALALASGTALAQAQTGQQAGAAATAQSDTMEGVVTNVNTAGRTLSVRLRNGQTETFNVAADTNIVFDPQRAAAERGPGFAIPRSTQGTLADIQQGDDVLLRFETRDGQRRAVGIERRARAGEAPRDQQQAQARTQQQTQTAAAAARTDQQTRTAEADIQARQQANRERLEAGRTAQADAAWDRADRLPDTSTSLAVWALLASLFAFASALGLRALARSRR